MAAVQSQRARLGWMAVALALALARYSTAIWCEPAWLRLEMFRTGWSNSRFQVVRVEVECFGFQTFETISLRTDSPSCSVHEPSSVRNVPMGGNASYLISVPNDSREHTLVAEGELRSQRVRSIFHIRPGPHP